MYLQEYKIGIIKKKKLMYSSGNIEQVGIISIVSVGNSFHMRLFIVSLYLYGLAARVRCLWCCRRQ